MKGVELVLTDMFKDMPEIQGSKPVFSFGIEQLNKFMKEKKDKYPLAYLVSNKEDFEKQGKESVVDVKMVLSVPTNAELFNEERYLITFSVLDELVTRIKEGLHKTANILWDGNISKFRHNKYTEQNDNFTIELIDAYRIEFTIRLVDKCQKAIQWQKLK